MQFNKTLLINWVLVNTSSTTASYGWLVRSAIAIYAAFVCLHSCSAFLPGHRYRFSSPYTVKETDLPNFGRNLRQTPQMPYAHQRLSVLRKIIARFHKPWFHSTILSKFNVLVKHCPPHFCAIRFLPCSNVLTNTRGHGFQAIAPLE